MNKDNIFYGIIGLLIGVIIGFLATNSINRNSVLNTPTAAAPGSTAASGGGALPPGHPPVDGAGQAEATAASEKARQEPSNFDVQMQAANLNYQAGNYPQALEFYDRSDKLKPNDFDALTGLGNVNYEMKRYPQALEFYDRAYKLKPNDFGALTNLGNVNFDMKRYTEAGQWYELALQLKPDAVNVRTDLGSTYFLREPHDLDKAIASYRASLNDDPRHERTLQNLTSALIEKGDKVAAREMLQRLAEVNPSNKALSELRAKVAAP